MINKFIKTASVVLLGVMLSQPAFAMSDYKNIYKIDYMDEVFRFDTGENSGDVDASEDAKNPYEFYMEVLKSFGIDLYDESGKKTYDSNAEYSDLYGAIASLISSDSEFIENYKSGNFTGNITMHETLACMVDVLGYTQIKEGMGVESIAYREGLLKGISYSEGRYIKIGELAAIIWNTLNAKGVEMTLTSNEASYRDTGETLMERQLDVYEVSGFLSAANGVNIYKNSSPNKGYVEIDRASYLAGDSDAAKYLGRRVTAYVQRDEYDYRTILYLTSEKNDENITIDLKDIYSVGNYIEYETEDGKLKKIDISNLSYVLFNGDATKNVSILNNFKNMDGNVTISKTEKNGKYDVAIINAYEYFVVYSIDVYQGRIYLKDYATFKGQNYIEIPEDEIVFCTLDGETVSFENLSAGESIRVIQNSSKSYTDIQASSGTVTGKISGIDSDTGIVEINGSEYRVSKTYENNAYNRDIKYNLFGVFYVTKDKYIAGFKDGNEAIYAYLKKIKYNSRTEEAQATVFTQMGKWETFTLKKKITLDGREKTEDKDAVDSINNYLNANPATEPLIRYKVNGANEITFIDTLNNTSDESDDNKRLRFAYENEVEQSWQGGRWFRTDDGYRILDDSPVFLVPKDTGKTDEYSVKAAANLNNDNQKIYIKLYNADDIGICEVAIISGQGGNKVGEDTPYWFYCEKVASVWNEENQEIDYVMIGTRVKTSSMECSDDFEVKVLASQMERYEGEKAGSLSRGAFMKLTYDADGYMADAENAFVNATLPAEFWAQSNTKYYQYFCGTITNVDPERGYIVVVAEGKKKEFPLQRALCIDSSNNNKIRPISVGELRANEKAYVYKSGGWGRICVVVR